MRCCSVRLLLVAMLATHHTDFEIIIHKSQYTSHETMEAIDLLA